MPHVVVYNLLPSEIRDDSKLKIIKQIIVHAFLFIKELRLKANDISYTFPEDPSIRLNERPVVAIVELLFEKPERTLEVRKKLAMAIREGLYEKLDKMRESYPFKIEVAIKRFNPEKDGFCS